MGQHCRANLSKENNKLVTRGILAQNPIDPPTLLEISTRVQQVMNREQALTV